MMLYEKFVGRNRDDFSTLDELQRNFKITAPENFNFAYDCTDEFEKQMPDALALLWVGNDGEERRYTFKDIAVHSRKIANMLAAQGIKKGDVVMCIMSRDWRYWGTLMAIHRLGAAVVPASYQLTAKDIVYRVNSADVKAVIVTPKYGVTAAIEEALPECRTLKTLYVFGGAAPSDKWLNFDADFAAASSAPTERTAGGKDVMLISFTSGTTDHPKMATHDFTYPLGHIMTGCFWHRCEDGGIHFTISDTGWLKSLWGKMYSQWLAGSAVFVYDFDKFNAKDILQKIQDYKITTFCAPPTMYRFMIQEDLTQYNFSHLSHCSTAGESLNPEVFRAWLKGTGKKIFEGFGQTETTISCWTGFPWIQPRLGSMGLPVPGYRMIVADQNGNEVDPGVTGEICIRTDEEGGGRPYGMFIGYHKDEKRTSEVWHDGLYHTGDTAYKDEAGFLWYVGRTDDVIKSSGYRIGPAEIESVLMEHPSVVECAVTSLPDEVRGQVVKATIVLAKGYEPSKELVKELKDFVKNFTAPYKYPRVIEFWDSLPKNTSYKILRREIRARDVARIEKGEIVGY